MTVLEKLLERRAALVAERKAMLNTADTEKRTDFTPEEDTKWVEIRTKIAALDTEIVAERDSEARDAAHAASIKALVPAGPVQSPASLVTEERTYRPGGEFSYVDDVVAARRNNPAALERLERNEKEESEARSITTGSFNASGIAAGAFIVPTFLQDGVLAVNRAKTIYADGVTNLALPGGMSSIEMPRLTGGAAADEQAGELQPLVEGSLGAELLTARVKTYGGNQVISLQAIMQSSQQWDQVVLRDIASQTASKVNRAALTAALASAIVVNAPGTTMSEVFSAIVGASSTITTGRFDVATRIVMSPRRWAFCQGALDTTGRPLVSAYNPTNAIGNSNANGGSTPVGEIAGLPVYVDPFILTGVGSPARDTVIVEKADDVMLWKSPMYTRAVDTTEWADSLGVLLQAYQFAMVLTTRAAVNDGSGNYSNAAGTVALKLTGLPA